MTAERLIALVGQPEEQQHSRHFLGFPPELTGGIDYRERLPWPRVVLIEEKNSGIFLYRFTENGSTCGDTWHQNLDEAKEQAAFEYGHLLAGWHNVPPDVADPIAFALAVNNQ